MKCDGLPDPVCVRELNTYLSLWKEDDTREDIDQVRLHFSTGILSITHNNIVLVQKGVANEIKIVT